MGMDSKTLELQTLWRELSPEAKARMLEKARYVALTRLGWKRHLSLRRSFELPAAYSDKL
jgi:hypothetical protein